MALLACPVVIGRPQYEPTIIRARECSLLGWPPTVAYGVNDLGSVVGYHFQCDFDWGDHSAFVWTSGGGLVTLEVPSGFQQAEAHDINDAGQVVGFVYTNVNQALERAVMWEDGKVIELGLLPGATDSWATAISDGGTIVGTSVNFTFGPYRPFVWQNGLMTDLDLPLGPNGGANDINDQGDIVGWMGESFLDPRAFLWSGGEATQLGVVPGGLTSNAMAVNDRQQVVVQGNLGIKGGHYIVHSFLWENGEMVDLGTLPGTTSTRAYAINDDGQIVGYCHNQQFTVERPFLWQDGQMIDINQFILDHPEIQLREAWSINNGGQIAGWASNGPDALGLLLTPVAPSADLDGDGVVGHLDLTLLLDSWGACAGPPGDCAADLDGNGAVGITDLLMLLAAWG